MDGRGWGGGRYRGVHLLGRGATSEVWRAEDLSRGRDVAVKSFVPAQASAHDLDGDRFRTEVRLLERLGHPHVVPLWDAGVDDDSPWCAMHLAEGGSLARPTPRTRAVDVGSIATQVTAALEHIHGHGIVHRDLKPANILLDPDGHAYLSDFGIARSDGDLRLTRTGCIVGTAAYLSPEQVRGESVTPACDIYALGLTLLELFTGRTEYAGLAVESAVARLSRSPVVPEALPTPWQDLLRAMTASDPTDRPDAAQVNRTLHRMPATSIGAASTGAPARVTPQPPPQPHPQPLTAAATDPRTAWARPPRPTPRRGRGRLRWTGAGAGLALTAGAVCFVVLQAGQAAGERGTGTAPPSPVAVPPHVVGAPVLVQHTPSPAARERSVTPAGRRTTAGTSARTAPRPGPLRPGSDAAQVHMAGQVHVAGHGPANRPRPADRDTNRKPPDPRSRGSAPGTG